VHQVCFSLHDLQVSEISIWVFIHFLFLLRYIIMVSVGRQSFSAHDVYSRHSRFNHVKLQAIMIFSFLHSNVRRSWPRTQLPKILPLYIYLTIWNRHFATSREWKASV